jgi:16S rRNA (uracil1498-N3)-methyltransferase
MTLFYNPDISEETPFSLSPEESKHCAKVLRKNIGDTVQVTDGKGFLFKGILMEVHPASCVVMPSERQPGTDNKSYGLHLAVSPLRTPARWEWMLEKATEAGVQEITPTLCHRTERYQYKPERWNKIVVAAMKQSLRSNLPVIHPPTPFEQVIRENRLQQSFIAWCNDAHKRIMLQEMLDPGVDALIMVGPEGDFTHQEVEMALNNNCIPVTLGNERLRSETAALAACFTFKITNRG